LEEDSESDDKGSELDDDCDEFIVEKIVSYIGNVNNPKTLLFNVK